MRFLTAIGLRACCAALGLLLANVHAAEAKSVIGATRDQILARYGEPKSTIVAGSRELWFYPKERLTLRDGVVIDAEPIAEAPRRPPPPAGDVAAPAGAAPSSGQNAPAGASTPAQGSPAAAPGAGSVTSSGGSSAGAGPANPAAGSGPAGAATPTTESEPQISIKRVLPPGATAGAATKPAPAPAPVRATTPAATPPGPSAPTTPPATNPVVTSPAQVPPTAAPSAAPATVSQPPGAGDTSTDKLPAASAPAPADAASGADTAAASIGKNAPDKDALSKKMAARRKTLDAKLDAEPEPSMFSATSYVIAGAVLLVGIGFLVWRRRQRQLELAATALSRTPFGSSAGTTSGLGARFTLELLAKLEWKRFEELVASYYSKTGVVAVRTKTGPASPVHIKISWKGEPRPFACVQCLSHPASLIDAKPLQELVTVLGAEDIRRGYVVSTGKFNVPARDYAEEKHLTLLSGDIFLEKLNALPDAARAELMQEVTTGDYTTPSCPKCDSKMIRSPDEPGVWRCPSHPDQTITSR